MNKDIQSIYNSSFFLINYLSGGNSRQHRANHPTQQEGKTIFFNVFQFSLE
jgi:hypothetical protein